MDSLPQNTKQVIWHWVILVQVALCAVFVVGFFCNLIGQPSTEKIYHITDGTDALRQNIAQSTADSIDTRDRSPQHCVDLMLDRHIRVSCWVSQAADTVIVDSYLYFKDGFVRAGRFGDPTFSGSSLRMQLEVINTFEREVLGGATFRSETSHLVDAASYLYMLTAPWLGCVLPTLLITVFLYRRMVKKQDNKRRSACTI